MSLIVSAAPAFPADRAQMVCSTCGGHGTELVAPRHYRGTPPPWAWEDVTCGECGGSGVTRCFICAEREAVALDFGGDPACAACLSPALVAPVPPVGPASSFSLPEVVSSARFDDATDLSDREAQQTPRCAA